MNTLKAGVQNKYQNRVDNILDRLNGMHMDIENDKSNKLRSLQKQLTQTEGALRHWEHANIK